jgi:hypothetical protein
MTQQDGELNGELTEAGISVNTSLVGKQDRRKDPRDKQFPSGLRANRSGQSVEGLGSPFGQAMLREHQGSPRRIRAVAANDQCHRLKLKWARVLRGKKTKSRLMRGRPTCRNLSLELRKQQWTDEE